MLDKHGKLSANPSFPSSQRFIRPIRTQWCSGAIRRLGDYRVRDPKYNATLADAASVTDRIERLRRLAECERYPTGATLFPPLYRDVRVSRCKPPVRRFGCSQLDRQQFKYVWIDTKWRPS
jgi:hypothetical protein